MSETQTTAAVCELELKNGTICAVPAIGRCATCGRAFCLTHQARNPRTNDGYVNECAPCLTQRLADARERKQQAEADINEARNYFTSGAARADLLASRVQLVNIYRIEQKQMQGIFRKRSTQVRTSERGWLLGEFAWTLRHWIPSHSVGWDSNEGSYAYEGAFYLTALLDRSPECVFVAIHTVSGNYKVFHFMDEDNWVTHKHGIGQALRVKYLKDWPREAGEDGYVHGWEWVELAQAVRQLTTVPS